VKPSLAGAARLAPGDLIVLTPYPLNGGIPGISTPPHLFLGGYPNPIAYDEPPQLPASAWDPDGQLLGRSRPRWSATAA